MKSRRLGNMQTSVVGLGGWPMSEEGRPNENRCIHTIAAALDAGVRLIDTADSYHAAGEPAGHNELLIAKALREYGQIDDLIIATKGGQYRDETGMWHQNGSPSHIKAACENSLRRLSKDAIDLYQFHRPDPATPFADSIGAFVDLIDKGKIKMVGICNTNEEQIRIAYDILGANLVSVQNEFSFTFRSSEKELVLSGSLGITFMPWYIFGGRGQARHFAASHPTISEIANNRGVSTYRVCIAWLLAKSPAVLPIPGATRPESILDCVAGAELELSEEEFAKLDTPPAGSRE